MTDTTNRYFGSPIRRNEDRRLLTGRALFVDDVNLPDMLHAAVLRSPHAHARIAGIDVSAALERDGVVAVYTAEDLGDFWQSVPLVVPPPPIEDMVFNQHTQVPLAKDKVRHLGEAVALVVAESRYVAEDALNDIAVDYEQLPAAADLEMAAASDAPRVHEDVAGNVAAKVHQTKGDYEAAAAQAATVVKRRFIYDHGMAQPMETRGLVAGWDAKVDRLTVWATTQAPASLRNGLAALLGLSEAQVRVIAPFVGGGFGAKLLMYYPEEILVPWAAIKLDCSVKWIEDRGEHFFATTQERGQIHDAEIALSEDGKILGIKDVFLHDTGAYNPYGLTVPINSQCSILGPYVVPAYDSAFTAVFTNKPIVAPYRGAGRQHGVFVIERLLDIAARALDIDRTEIRRRNFIPPDAFPFNNEIIFQDFTQLQYDSGNYEPILDRLLELIDYERFVGEEQPKLRAQGKHVGIGVVCYIEGTGIGPYEGAKVQVQASGKVCVATGIGTQGQSHFTTFAQIAADRLGVNIRDVDVITGDTDQFYWGAGTFASRGAVVAGNAVNEAANAVQRKVLRMAAEHFGCSEDKLVIEEGQVTVTGVPGEAIGIGDLAKKANPMRGAVEPDVEPGLEATRYFGPKGGTTASGAHAMIVEVDPETMMAEIKKYVVVHDCGTMINPLVVEGQIHGGVAQGIGNAFFEQLVFDEQGQILNATLADYLIPTSLDIPELIVDHRETPSTLNPLGIKGVGEAGAIPVGPLFAQALEDALEFPAKGVDILEIPLSPNRLWELAQS
ncbi:MAG: xanthine dehydrogenase family protein molybdopterin-binding subunit [Alphaproteobacteria bacterium]